MTITQATTCFINARSRRADTDSKNEEKEKKLPSKINKFAMQSSSFRIHFLFCMLFLFSNKGHFK